MALASWLLPIFWREHDWRVALERLHVQLASVSDIQSLGSLGRALEYIEPDRRRAIAAYQLAGPDGVDRARELATELGWWSARARLALAARTANHDPRLLVDEALAWWDAGQPDLSALALAGLRGPDRQGREARLLDLVAGKDLEDHAAEAVANAVEASSPLEAADEYVMAARFSHAAKRTADVARWLESALAAMPTHRVAASLLLGLARGNPDPQGIERLLRLCWEGADAIRWIDVTRGCAFSLIDSEYHRGFGLRLLRRALERAYETKHAEIPGHLAMWTALAAHAAADGTRRELLPFVIDALQASSQEIDRVWLGALAAEISLREANNPMVAGAYAEIVAEYAPEHPIVRELVTAVATSDEAGLPSAARVAAHEAEDDFAIDVDLDQLYVDATKAAGATPPAPAAPAKPAPPPLPPRVPPKASTPAPAPLPRTRRASVAPASIAKSAPVVPASIVPPRVVPAAAIAPANVPTARPQLAPMPVKPKAANVPSLARVQPVLDALRTPDRPQLPPRAADPPDAIERARRISIPIDVRLIAADGKRIHAHSRDLSTSGLFVLTTAQLELGAVIELELLLPGAEAFTEDEYRARGRIARQTDDGYGIELVAPEPALLKALAAL